MSELSLLSGAKRARLGVARCDNMQKFNKSFATDTPHDNTGAARATGFNSLTKRVDAHLQKEELL